MKHAALIPLVAVTLVGCTTDLDEDGWAEEDDCNDEDASVNPDGTEIRGDGIDQDCDGADLPHTLVGEWNLKTITLGNDYDYWGYYEDKVGTMTVTPALQINVDVSMTYTYDAYTYGYTLVLAGDGVAGATEADFSLDLSGTYSDIEDSSSSVDIAADWDCVVTDDNAECTGALSYDGYDYDFTATFERK